MECNPDADFFTDKNNSSVPRHLLIYAAVHCYIIFILGVVANSVALCCIWKCTKTKAAMKILMMTVFGALLLICLFTRVVMAENVLGILNCDPNRPTKEVLLGFVLLYSFGAQLELAAIAAVAVCRTAAVRASNTYELSKRVAQAVVVALVLYSILTSVVLLGSLTVGFIRDPVAYVTQVIYFFLNVGAPVLITIICYSLMIYEMRCNRLRMNEAQARCSRVINNATRGMVAVFISNLLFGLPHAMYHLVPRPPKVMDIAFHILFSTHFVIDPIVFIYFNHNYRRRVCEAAYAAWAWVAGKCGAPTPKTPSFTFGSTTASKEHESSREECGNATATTKQ